MATKLVVHLVHGTWPYGLLRLKRPSKAAHGTLWFDVVSDFAYRIKADLGSEVVLESFLWSGSQSVVARAAASEEFLDYLQERIEKYGDAEHLVVAHSHGGTVAANAFMNAGLCIQSPRLLDDKVVKNCGKTISKIKALVCIATPFSYVSPTLQHTRMVLVALSSLIAATISAAMLLSFTSIAIDASAPLLALAYGSVIIPLIWIFTRSWMQGTDGDGGSTTILPARVPIPDGISVLLIRATNDEAALVIGLAQSLSWILKGLYKPFIEERGSLSGALLSLLFLGLGMWLVPSIFGMDDASVAQRFVISFAIIPGLFGGVFIAGCGMLGIALGALNPRVWLAGEPVMDVTPPGVPCQFKSYSEVYFPIKLQPCDMVYTMTRA